MQTWAVVTGASGGLGIGYARHLAGLGVGIVLTARSADKLAQVAAELEADFHVPTKVYPLDLTDRQARTELLNSLTGLEVSYLVGNAGFGTIGSFMSADPQRLRREMELNIVALTELTHALLPGMVERGRGAIINVASTAAFQPIPTMAVYAASKAYVLYLSIALWEELRHSGVRVIAICPGPTKTDFFANAGDGSTLTHRRSVAQVVETTFAGLARHRPLVVDGTGNRVLALANRLAPASVQATIARRIVASES